MKFSEMSNALVQNLKYISAEKKAREVISLLEEKFPGERGFSYPTVNRYLQPGADIPERFIQKLATAFNVSYEDFTNRYAFDDYLIFSPEYHVYCRNTLDSEEIIDTGILRINNEKGHLRIKLKAGDKNFEGTYVVNDNFISFSLQYINTDNYPVFIVLPYPTKILSPKKYQGGLGLIMNPTKSGSVPCTQRLIVSNNPFHIDKNNGNYSHKDYSFLLKNLKISALYKTSIQVPLADYERVVDEIRKRNLNIARSK